MPAMLIGRYHAAINLQDWENLEDVFTTDAVWEVLAPVNLRFEGRDAVTAGSWGKGLAGDLVVFVAVEVLGLR